ncbi:hypothetical protein GCM10008955_30730 [Deinococcus malanensis]|uniref:Uncharacterized protein n=1 Tax=Deinococcus malanensis TaxID=1706855 RepID=A0ABQ2F044_9DEIO|nr:hypothetical protein GCM10008955_30730 [Deinococcus malanensis]
MFKEKDVDDAEGQLVKSRDEAQQGIHFDLRKVVMVAFEAYQKHSLFLSNPVHGGPGSRRGGGAARGNAAQLTATLPSPDNT